MNKLFFNIIIIAVIGLLLLVINMFGLLEQAGRFMFIPILAFYFIGQYSERKFRK